MQAFSLIVSKVTQFRLKTFMFLVTMFFVGYAQANDGESRYKQVCANCHGDKAQGKAEMNSPALAGQNAGYIVRQLQNFSTGLRGSDPKDSFGMQMAAMANTLSDDDARTKVADYLSSLDRTQAATADGDTDNGYKYYQASCGSCHGGKAEGNPSLSAPSLRGLSAEYIGRQHGNFLSGLRGGKNDTRYGRQMAMMAKTMTNEKHIRDVIAYITSIEDQR